MLQKLSKLMAMIEEFMVIALMSVLVLSLLFNILSRIMLNYSYQWTLEYAPLWVLWIAFWGTAVAIRKNKNIRLEVLSRFMGVHAFSIIYRVISGMSCLITLTCLYYSYFFIRDEVATFGTDGYVSLMYAVIFAWFSLRFFIEAVQGYTPKVGDV